MEESGGKQRSMNFLLAPRRRLWWVLVVEAIFRLSIRLAAGSVMMIVVKEYRTDYREIRDQSELRSGLV
jgi:hypothetical protein